MTASRPRPAAAVDIAAVVESVGLRVPDLTDLVVDIDARCTACGACLATCPERALRPAPRRPVVVTNRCTGCLACVEVCPRDAVSPVARPARADLGTDSIAFRGFRSEICSGPRRPAADGTGRGDGQRPAQGADR